MENRKLCLAYLSGIKKDTREQGGGGLGVWEGKKLRVSKKIPENKGDVTVFFWGGIKTLAGILFDTREYIGLIGLMGVYSKS